MKRDFTPDEFEDFLKESADGLRMRPPEQVWQNLSRELGKRRRRFFTALGAFLLVTSAAGYFITTNVSSTAVPGSHRTEQTETAAGKSTRGATAATPASDAPAPPAGTTDRQAASQSPIVGRGARSQSRVTLNEPEVSGISAQPLNREPEAETSFLPTVIDDLPADARNAEQQPTGVDKAMSKPAASMPLTIESVVNAYKAPREKRFSMQLHVAPTISYRKLTENKSYLRSLNPTNIPANYPALYSSVNNFVTHKPDVGFELGFSGRYAVSKNIRIRSGLQFNVNRYDVKAFNSSTSLATIALNNGSRVDSLNTLSRYSNIYGYKTNWLQNLSFQLSAPVGVELLFAGNEKGRFGVAATIQPTYVLGDRAYLISTDYKNYTEVPWLIRRWNVNTSLEAFATYKRWQFGPQVRYQLLSSFVSEYPVKENLFDFGLKVGVSLNK